MKRFIKNNQWGRRKTPLWKQFSVKTPGEPIVKTSLGVGVTRVRILKKSEIEELRQKGYTVEIIRKIQSRQPRSAADIIFKKETWQEHSSTFTVIDPITPPLHIEEGEDSSILGSCIITNVPEEYKRHRRNGAHLPIGPIKKSKKKHGNKCKRKSTKKELEEEYLVLVNAHAELTKRLADFGKKIHDALPDDETGIPVYNLFRPFVDENKLSDCFLYIFQKFFGALPTETLDGYYKKPIDLIAYLFILVEWERLANYIFSEKCKKPFFEFVKEKVLVEKLDTTERTFHNRLTVTMGDFRNNLMKEPISSNFKGERWKKDFFIKDFLKVVEIFHGTEYYQELAKRKHA